MADFVDVKTPMGDYTIDKDKIVSIHHTSGLFDFVTFNNGSVLVVNAGQLKGDEHERNDD